jgi:hypothetical protein
LYGGFNVFSIEARLDEKNIISLSFEFMNKTEIISALSAPIKGM